MLHVATVRYVRGQKLYRVSYRIFCAFARNFFFFFFFFFKCNRTIGSRSIGHRVWSMSLKLSEN